MLRILKINQNNWLKELDTVNRKYNPQAQPQQVLELLEEDSQLEQILKINKFQHFKIS